MSYKILELLEKLIAFRTGWTLIFESEVNGKFSLAIQFPRRNAEPY